MIRKNWLLGMLLLFTISTLQLNAQTAEWPLDESLIARVGKTADGGYLSKMDIKRSNALVLNETSAKVLSFEFVWIDTDGKEVVIKNEGAEFNEQIISKMKATRIGGKVQFRDIKVENSSGQVKCKPVKITIKS